MLNRVNTNNINIFCRLSKVASQKLQDGNSSIADLSDTNRPTRLAEKFSELYDNEFTDAFQELHPTGTKNSDEPAIKTLNKILKVQKLMIVI